MPDTIHLTVATIVQRDGKFLMVHERDGDRTVINQPAGHIEPGETPQQAALRETLEETGWQVELTGFLGLFTYRSPRNGVTYYRIAFTAEPLALADGAELDHGIIAARWHSLAELEAVAHQLRSPLVLHNIRTAVAGDIHPLSLVDNRCLEAGP